MCHNVCYQTNYPLETPSVALRSHVLKWLQSCGSCITAQQNQCYPAIISYYHCVHCSVVKKQYKLIIFLFFLLSTFSKGQLSTTLPNKKLEPIICWYLSRHVCKHKAYTWNFLTKGPAPPYTQDHHTVQLVRLCLSHTVCLPAYTRF